jgi:hypothetical protein
MASHELAAENWGVSDPGFSPVDFAPALTRGSLTPQLSSYHCRRRLSGVHRLSSAPSACHLAVLRLAHVFRETSLPSSGRPRVSAWLQR